MGLSIIGGSDHFCVPFGASPDDPGVYISKITAGGSAHKTGSLRMGDRILKVCRLDGKFSEYFLSKTYPFLLKQISIIWVDHY